MNPDGQPTLLLELLRQQLARAVAADKAALAANAAGDAIDIPSTGQMIVGAYEQLRNATEYTEEHLLLQRAIQRFFVRNLFLSKIELSNIGRELIVELMQAGYLRGGRFGAGVAGRISQAAKEALATLEALKAAGIGRNTATDWVIWDLAVLTEETLNPKSVKDALAYVAYQHFLEVLPRPELTTTDDERENYEISLYVAVQQALLKSDLAIVRRHVLAAYSVTPANLSAYIDFCRKIDGLFLSPLTNRLKRVVSKNAAPFRVLRAMVEARPAEFVDLSTHREHLLEVFDKQVSLEYEGVNQRINRGVVKSIVFILITKALIAMAVEVPYDLLMSGMVLWVPLAINLTVPPVYMASLRLSLTLPPAGNARALRAYIDAIFYARGTAPLHIGDPNRLVSGKTRWLFGVLIVVPLAVTVYLLSYLAFNPVQTIIFFVFLSTASFLGFRLSNMIRELEMSSRRAGLLSSLRDFFYLPFILFGQWLSGKYAQVNVIGYFLDIAIELPLKNLLRLVRQWISFVNDRRDEII